MQSNLFLGGVIFDADVIVSWPFWVYLHALDVNLLMQYGPIKNGHIKIKETLVKFEPKEKVQGLTSQ